MNKLENITLEISRDGTFIDILQDDELTGYYLFLDFDRLAVRHEKKHPVPDVSIKN